MEHIEGKKAADDTVCEVTGKTVMPGVRAVEARDRNENGAGTIVDKEDGIEGALQLAVISVS